MESKETKICPRCGRELPLDEFYKKTSSPDGHQTWCKECTEAAVKENKKRRGKTSEPKGLTRYSDSQLISALQGRSHKILVDPTPRTLMETLAKMGYKGKLEYTETHVIDINDF